MNLQTENLDKVKRFFSEYLEKNRLRKTPERFAILEEIYAYSHHFQAEALYTQMQNKKYRVSRSTVYNTLELLKSCNLITKREFGQNATYFEKSYSYKQHGHLICLGCNTFIDFCDPRLQQIKNSLSSSFNFKVQHHALNIYGYCNECATSKSYTNN